MMTFLLLCASGAAAFSILGPAAPARAAASRQSIAMQAVANKPIADNVWAIAPGVKIQGNTLKTWDIGDESIQRTQLSIKSDGRPLHTNVELWHTPAYIPTHMKVYTEDGKLRPINAVIETPKSPKTVAVYNTAPMDFPFEATVANTGLPKPAALLTDAEPQKVQGGQIMSYTFGGEVESVQILLSSTYGGDLGGRNMKAKIELTQGPNQIKQTFELYASSGYKNPFYAVIQTPGMDVSTLRVINKNTVEFPFNMWVLPYETIDTSDMKPIMGGF